MTNDTIFYVGGSKGGVGKSMVSMCLIDYLISRYAGKKNVVLIETDKDNPDVQEMYNGTIATENVLLDEDEKGWIFLFRTIKKYEGSFIVINNAAGSNAGIRMNGNNFQSAIEEKEADLITLWPMNRHKESVDSLIEYSKIINVGAVYPIKNLYFGKNEEFVRFEKTYGSGKESKFLQNRIPRDMVLNLPALNDLIVDEIYEKKLMLKDVAGNIDIFERQIYRSWREKVHRMFEDTQMIAIEEGE
jgi:hypothetical protein